MSKQNDYENDLLSLLFTATAIANIADNAASAPNTDLFIALHTADPGEAGDQTTSEATYTSYARVTVARTTGGWTVLTGTVDNDAAITFPEATGGSSTVTFFSVGKATSGAGKIFYSGALTASLAVTTGITPSFAAGDCNVSED